MFAYTADHNSHRIISHSGTYQKRTSCAYYNLPYKNHKILFYQNFCVLHQPNHLNKLIL